MNDRQRKFCEIYTANPNATEAAKAAGYSRATAGSIGQRLLKNVDIKKYISELTAAERTERVAKMNEVLEYLTDVMRNPEELTRERTKAAKQLISVLKDTTEEEEEKIDGIEIRIIDASGDNLEE